MKHPILMTTFCAAALAVLAGASSTAALGRDSASGSLQINAALVAGYEFGLNWCPAGTPATTEDCVHFVGAGAVPGLGHVTETYTKSFDPSICPDQVTSHPNVVLEVAGKGEIEVSMNPWPSCADPAASSPSGVTSLLEGTITRGTGKFAGASGSLKVTNHVSPPSSCAAGCRGSAEDVWTGTLIVPGMEFDLTPPVLSGARPKTVKAPRTAKFARVRYAVKAQDGVDGAVPVKCKPASGSRFKVGRTKVTCFAEDTSANVATTQFTVTVKRRGGSQ
jgi:hypothetical protein